MSEELEQVVTPEEVTNESEAPEEVQSTEADTVEEETDEQKNERVQREAQERADKRSRGVQKRIDELTREKHEERTRANELMQQNARILALLEAQKQAPVSEELNREQFNSDADYVLALARQEAEKIADAKLARLQEQQQREFEQKTQAQQEAEVVKRFTEKREEVAKSLPDYKEVVADWSPNLPDSVAQMIIQLEEGPLIAYHLAKNPDLEAQFHAQPAYKHGVILGQLIATLKNTSQTTKAPPVGKTVSSTSAGTSTEPPSDPEKYMEWAKKHMR